MFSLLPPATRSLLLINIAVYLAELVLGDVLIQLFALWPLGTQFQPWQIVTYAFLHGSPTHILFNMLALFMFGGPLERYWGSRRFLAYYAACVVSAALVQLLSSALAHSAVPVLGASGGIFGLLLAFALYFPRQRIMLLFPPIPLPAWLFVLLYGLLELFLGVTGTMSEVAHFAHLGGMLGGAALILYWRALEKSGRRARSARGS